jgi:Fe2+ or Zn2+ uptake regulation protein
MTIKIVGIICTKCNSILTYEKSDIKSVTRKTTDPQFNYSYTHTYVTCSCRNEITIYDSINNW